jgi:preprotein translocase subunit Sss1
LVYQLNRFSLSLKAANLTNNDYFDIANVPTPGISLMGGVKYIIND